MSERKALRCAVYTRKSSEEGLEQDFNSLEAQREACEAYIRSQAHEGWKLIADRFDDGGFSGGNIARPALARLMDLVRDGKVDVIVIYKIDRLTRSLTDFARLAETFDKHAVSFVSVTQQFNTTTSMGRLMLNVLLSFAQFEREITGERIRDKIAASKRKGMWMGGNVPMGYDVTNRQLVINEPDAETVRKVFQLYLEAGTVPALLDRLNHEGIRTAARTSASKSTGDRPFTRGHVYKLLSNPIYVGRIAHKGVTHRGQHPPIIDTALWDAVQAQLATNTQGPRSRRTRAALRQSLLADLMVSKRGGRFIHSHATTKGRRRYRYYVESTERLDGSGTADTPVRLPAQEIEQAALAALLSFVSDQRQVRQCLGEILPEQVGALPRGIAGLIEKLTDRNRSAHVGVFRPIVGRVVWQREALTLTVSQVGLRGSLGLPVQGKQAWPANETDDFTLRIPLSTHRRGQQMKLVVNGVAQKASPDHSLLVAAARARTWADRLITGGAETITQIAEEEGVTDGYVGRILPLAFLARSLVEDILLGQQPLGLTADRLAWQTELPVLWTHQNR